MYLSPLSKEIRNHLLTFRFTAALLTTMVLVVLPVLWLAAVFAIPGVGRLIAEQVVHIRTQAEVRDEISQASQEIRGNAPNDAGIWNGDPFAANIPSRGKLWSYQIAARRRIRDDYYNSLILQTKTAQAFASTSFYGLFNDSLQMLASSWIYRFRQLLNNSIEIMAAALPVRRQSRRHGQYYTPPGLRLLFPLRRRGFSMKPVPLSAVPKFANQWAQTGHGGDPQTPWLQILVLLGFNLVAGLAALIALLRYDPR